MKRDLPIEHRSDFTHLTEVQTRWDDNDIYGHVNNVVYYAYFDTVINRFLIERGGLDIADASIIGVCVESGCRYLASVAYPEKLDVGLRVSQLGNSSVRYELGVFRQGHVQASAVGHFVHVFVDRVSRKPTPIPERLRAALATLLPAN